VIGRWNVIDAYAEHPDQINLSPYVYVGDNPIDRTDPDGNCPPCTVGNGRGASDAFNNCKNCNGNPDWNNVQENLDKTSDASGYGELAGITISAGGAPEVGVPVVAASTVIGTGASLGSIAIDAFKGNFAKAEIKGAALVISTLTGKAIDNSTAKAGVKLALNATKAIVEKLVDNMSPHKGPAKIPNMNPTMQRSSIPKPPPPPKPILKKDQKT
jgi:hypothetical protein